jgi:hypothetical protein
MAARPDEPGAWWTKEGWRWLIVTLLIPFAGFVWNEVEKHNAERAKVIEDKRAESEIVIKLLPSLAGDPAAPARGIAMAVLNSMAQAGALREELKTAVDLAIKESDERARAGKATDSERAGLTTIASKQDRSVEGVAAAGTAGTPPAAPLITTPRVYVQIYGDADRAMANDLRAWVNGSKHWLAPAVEDVTATAARKGGAVPKGTAQIRVVYFNGDDAHRAEEVAQWIRDNQSTDVIVQSNKLKAPPGQLEVWYPQPAG